MGLKKCNVTCLSYAWKDEKYYKAKALEGDLVSLITDDESYYGRIEKIMDKIVRLRLYDTGKLIELNISKINGYNIYHRGKKCRELFPL